MANISFRDYALEWYEVYKKPQLGVGYRANCKSMLNVHILPAIDHKDIAEITVADVQRIYIGLNGESFNRHEYLCKA